MRRVESTDGLVLDAGRCRLEMRRLRPGSVLLDFSGDDAGELGEAPYAELDREIARYGPLDLLVDARGMRGVAPAVADAWTAFLRQRPAIHRALLIVSSRQVALAAESARALAGRPDRLEVTADAGAFDAALAQAGGASPRPAPATVQRETLAGGSVALAVGGFRAVVAREGPRAALVTMSGFDTGAAGAALFDEIGRVLAGATRWTVLLDASACTGIGGRSADAWVAWVAAHRDQLAAIHVLATNPGVRLTVGLEGEIAGMRPVLRMHTDPAEFERLRAAAVR